MDLTRKMSRTRTTARTICTWWCGPAKTTSPRLLRGSLEVFGQLIDGATGAAIGGNDFRISDMGDDSETDPSVRDDFGAVRPRAAYNATQNEFLVVWYGDDDTDRS